MPSEQPVDLLIVGGGINGAGIARDAAGRGLSVLLCEQNDLASGTSSASSKLIHGGLRYLELYDFRLVREALTEREVLLSIAPHVVRPMRFVLPHVPGMRPAWMLRLGLLLYDMLGRRRYLHGSRRVDLRHHAAGTALQSQYSTGFTYSDCWADDSRLVVLNAMDAAQRGALVRTRTEVRAARREGRLWRIALQPRDGSVTTVAARALVYAAGPWMKRLLETEPSLSAHRLRLVKGSHLVFPQFYEGFHAFILQNVDGRIVFAIPYLDRYTLVGTTDVDYHGDPAAVHIDADEAAYLCAVVNRYFRVAVTPQDALWTYSGLRPLLDNASQDPAELSREYVLDLKAPQGQAPVVSLLGGKLTAYRQVAEKTLNLLAPYFPGHPGPWTARAPLPGGDMPPGRFAEFLESIRAAYPWLAPSHALRLARAYGTLTHQLLAGATSTAHLGRHFGADLYEREVAHMMDREWAVTADDALWRRSKLGLALTAQEAEALGAWMQARGAAAQVAGTP